MPPKRETGTMIEDLISALSDKRVMDAIANVFEQKLQPLLHTITTLQEENKHMSNSMKEMEHNLVITHKKIDELEPYSRLNNLVFAGLGITNYSEAASVPETSASVPDNSTSTESAILNLINTILQIPMTPEAISIAHRLKPKRASTSTPPPIIVKFVSRKVRNTVYSARRLLRGSGIYINEDLTSNVADLYRQARLMLKQKLIFGCWTSGGMLYAKKTRESEPIRLATKTDLQSL